jgi:ornithine decarboxylase
LLKQNEALSVARLLRPTQPVTLVRPHAARRAARFFLSKFPGTSMYAVKANPSADLIRTLWDAGLTHYDVASIAEVRLVREVAPNATLGLNVHNLSNKIFAGGQLDQGGLGGL